MISNSLGAAHVTAAAAALVLGFIVLVARKGTDLHRLFGTGFVVAIIVVNVTALGLYPLTGQFNAFHALALLSLATTFWGLMHAVRRRADWLAAHLTAMAFSYLGLLAAATTEAVLRLHFMRELIRSPAGIVTFGVLIALVFALLGAALVPRLRESARKGALG